MKLRLKATKVLGKINMTSSKSLFHRYLIMASLSEGTRINFSGLSKDVEATISSLQNLGVYIDLSENYLFIKKGNTVEETDLFMNESGSTFRFILPYCFIEKRQVSFSGKGKLDQRPTEELIDVLIDNGIKFSNSRLPFKASGRISGSHFIFSGSTSSQYISAFIMAASLMNRPVTIEIRDKIQSKAYIDMTIDLVREFGIDIKVDENWKKIEIDGRNYKAPSEINIEGDWSNAWALISHGLLGEKIEIYNLNKNSYQGDSNLSQFLKDKNGNINQKENSLIINNSSIENLSMDIDNNIDLFPVFSVLSLYCNSKSVFKNIKRLKFKESDRIQSIKSLLNKAGCKYKHNEDEFIVYPDKSRDESKGISVDSCGDHRIVMAASLLAYKFKYVDIEGFEDVQKSYPKFFDDLQELGFDLQVMETDNEKDR